MEEISDTKKTPSTTPPSRSKNHLFSHHLLWLTVIDLNSPPNFSHHILTHTILYSWHWVAKKTTADEDKRSKNSSISYSHKFSVKINKVWVNNLPIFCDTPLKQIPWSRNGTRLATSQNGRVVLWDWRPNQAIWLVREFLKRDLQNCKPRP